MPPKVGNISSGDPEMAEDRLRRDPPSARAGDVDLDRDRALVRRCQEGEGAAFAELYTQYHDRLHRFCLRRLLNRDEADEITQEAFLRAWRALPTFSGEMRFYPWLTVIAKNLCTDAIRRRARYGTVEDLDRQPAHDVMRSDPSSMALSSEEAVMAAFDGQLAAQALTRLSDRHRNVLALREERGLSYQEIARAEGVEISTVETLLWRARQALKREYAQLAGVRVLGGALIAGGALRRLLERATRRAMRVADALSRVNGKGIAAAGVVTVALAGVAVTQVTHHGGPPSLTATTLAAPGAAGYSPTGTLFASTTPTTGAPVTPTTPPTSPSTGSGAPSTGPTRTGATTTPGAIGGVGSAAQNVAQVGGQLPPQLASQVPSIVSTVASNLSQLPNDVNQAAAGVTGSLPAPPVTVPAPVTNVVNGLSGLAGN